MAWAVWLAIPIVVTALAAIWSWLRSRPAPTLDTDDSMRAHEDYLAALVEPVRGAARAEPAGTGPQPEAKISSRRRAG